MVWGLRVASAPSPSSFANSSLTGNSQSLIPSCSLHKEKYIIKTRGREHKETGGGWKERPEQWGKRVQSEIPEEDNAGWWRGARGGTEGSTARAARSSVQASATGGAPARCSHPGHGKLDGPERAGAAGPEGRRGLSRSAGSCKRNSPAFWSRGQR